MSHDLYQQSPILGQLASSQIVYIVFLTKALVFYTTDNGALTLIHSGFLDIGKEVLNFSDVLCLVLFMLHKSNMYFFI